MNIYTQISMHEHARTYVKKVNKQLFLPVEDYLSLCHYLLP